MVVRVSAEPESEPMLRAASFEERSDTNSLPRRNSITDARENTSMPIKGDPLIIKSHKTALELLATAFQLQNMPLVRECIENLDQTLNKDNVLTIYSFLSKCKTPVPKKHNYEPSAPPIIENDTQKEINWVDDLLEQLRHNCLLIIDQNADYILSKKEITDLSYNDFYNLADRDSLEVSNELVVYCAMYRWGIAECSRMTLQHHHMKEVLRQLCYVPRYGLMTKKDFCCRSIDGMKGPARSGILEEKEWRQIKFHIEEKAKNRPVRDLDSKMSLPRIPGNAKPIILSSRSEKNDKTIQKVAEPNCKRKTKCEKFIINFLTCWTAVFD